MAQKSDASKPPRSASIFTAPSRALHRLSKTSGKRLSAGKARKHAQITSPERSNANGDNFSNSDSVKRSVRSGHSTVESIKSNQSGNNRSLKSDTIGNKKSADTKEEYEVDEKCNVNAEAISSGAETYRSQISYESSNQEQNPARRSTGPVDIDSGEVISEEKSLFGKGNIYLQNGEYKKAQETFYQILRNHNKEPCQLLASIYYNLGVSHTKLQSFSKALDAFHNSVRIYKKCELMNHPNLAMTFVRLGFLHLESIKNYRKSLQAFHEALKIREIVYGRRHPLTAKVHNNLGVAYHHRKKYSRAKEHFQCALETQRYVLAQLSQDPGNKNIQRANMEVANTLDNLGSLVIDDVNSADSFDRKAALEAIDEAYQIRLQRYGVNHPAVESTLEKLEMVKKLVSGLIPNTTHARRRNPSLGESANTPIGNYSADTDVPLKNSLSPPASTLYAPSSQPSIQSKTSGISDVINFDTSDDLTKSKNLLFVRPLEDGLNNLCHTPGNDEGTTALLNDIRDDMKLIYEMACSSLKAGDYDKSLELYNSFLDSLQNDSSQTNPLTGMAWHDIGIIHLREERFSNALAAFQRAVKNKRETLGNDHPDVAVSIVKVGIVQLLQHQHDLALEAFDEALCMRSKSLGDLHPSTARIYNNIGCIHVHASRMSDARVAYEHALDIQRSAMVETNDKALVLESAMTLINLGILYRHQKSWKEAEVVLWEAYRLQRNVLGPNHMTVLSTLDAIADIMAWNGDAESALKYYKTVLRILRNHHRTSPRTRPACLLLYKMHRIYVAQNNYPAAWKCLSEARVLSKQCPELDERSYALEKRIASEMEKMEELSKISLTAPTQKVALNNTDIAIAPPTVNTNPTNVSIHNNETHAILNNIATNTVSHKEPSQNQNVSSEKSRIIEKETVCMEVKSSEPSANHILEISDAESCNSSKPMNQDQMSIECSTSDYSKVVQEEANIVQKEPHQVTMNTANGVLIDSSVQIKEKGVCSATHISTLHDDSCVETEEFENSRNSHSVSAISNDFCMEDKGEEDPNIIRNESSESDSRVSADRDPINAVASNESCNNIKDPSSTAPSVCTGSNSDRKPLPSKPTTTGKYGSRNNEVKDSGNSHTVSAVPNDFYMENKDEEYPNTIRNEFSEDRTLFLSKIDTVIAVAPNGSCNNIKDPPSTAPSVSSGSNSDRKPLPSKPATTSKHRSRMEALLANCATGNTSPVMDARGSNSTSSDSSFESDEASSIADNSEIRKITSPSLGERHSEFKSRLQSMISNRAGTNTARPWARISQQVKQDDDSEDDSEPDYSFLTNQYDDSTDESDNNFANDMAPQDILNHVDNSVNPLVGNTMQSKDSNSFLPSCAPAEDKGRGNASRAPTTDATNKFAKLESLFAVRSSLNNGVELSNPKVSKPMGPTLNKVPKTLAPYDLEPLNDFVQIESLFTNRSGTTSCAEQLNSDATNDLESPNDYETLKTEFDMLAGLEQQPNDYVSLKNEFEQLESGFSHRSDIATTELPLPTKDSKAVDTLKNKFGKVESLFASRSRINTGIKDIGESADRKKGESPLDKLQDKHKSNKLESLVSDSSVAKPKICVGKLEGLFAERSGKLGADHDDGKSSKLKKNVPKARPKTAEVQNPSESNKNKSSDIVPLKDDPKFTKYFKMLKVGMPKETVMHSMSRDGIDPTILNGDPNLPAKVKTETSESKSKEEIALKDNPSFTKYFKMLKVGMPRDSVKHAMKRDNIDPNILDGDPNLPVVIPKKTSEESESAPEIALKDNPRFTKYFKMLKVGMPRDSVKHAMKRDNIDPNILDGDPNLPAVTSKKTSKESELAPKIALKDDPRFTKYFKMLKVGMPRDSVKHAMVRDNIDPNILDGDPNLPVLIPKKTSKESELAPKKKIRRTRIHWDTIQQEVKSGSVWALVKEDPDIDNMHIDDSEIKQLFEADIKSPKRISKTNTKDVSMESERNVKDQGSIQTDGHASQRGNAPKKKSACSVKVIDPKRANNGGISLARVKISFDEIARVIDKMETSSLSQQQFQGILEYLPTSEEVKSLNKFLSGVTDEKRMELICTLCECEKFMVAMMNVNNAAKKITSLLFRLQFDTTFMELERDAALIDDACDELSNSLRLRKLLGIVLNVGNRVNMGAATAFSITSLLKLNQTKSMDKKTTILHYVVTVAKRTDESLLHFKEDLPSVFKSEKVFWDHCLNGAKELEVQLNNVIKLALKSDQSSSTKISIDICDFSTKEMEILSSTYVGQFVLDAVLKISVLKQQIDTTNQSYTQLLQYFHEETLQPHEFFNVIVRFSRNFDSAKAEVEADEKAKKRGKKSVMKPLSTAVFSSSKSSKVKLSEKTETQLKQSASLSFNSVLHELKNKAALVKNTNSDSLETGITSKLRSF